MKGLIKSLIPPILISILKKIKYSRYGFKGSYKNWQAALQKSTGYDQDNILKTIKESGLKVKNKEAVSERDGVIFNKIQYSWPILAGLMYASRSGRMKVLDFGGSLGSTYFQNKRFLDDLTDVTWNVVEQKNYVDVGKESFESEVLKFHYSIEDCIKKEGVDILLLSGVLQYLENPFTELEKMLENNFEYILIDRTICGFEGKDEIKIQVVSPDIYEASYPCWFLDVNKLRVFFISKNYKIVEEFGCNLHNLEYCYKGFILKKNKIKEG